MPASSRRSPSEASVPAVSPLAPFVARPPPATARTPPPRRGTWPTRRSRARTDTVDRWCDRHGVVRLPQLPHKPEHNPWVERGHLELKQESGIGKGVVIDSVVDATCDLVRAVLRVDGNVPRTMRGGKTAWEAYRDLPEGEVLADREAFREEAACAMEAAVPESNGWRARRLAQREAVLRTMERLGLITRTRGRAPKGPEKPAGVS